MSGRLPIDYREQLDTIKSLPGSWYATQEIPPRLIANIARTPVLQEWEINRLMYTPRILSQHVAEVLECAANGMTNLETAAHLFKSVETVKHHRKQALSTLRCRSIAQAVAVAIRLGILVAGDDSA